MNDLQRAVEEWHRRVFPWATPLDCLAKLNEECHEAIAIAEGIPDEPEMLADELADCLICIVAAAIRAGIDLDAAVADKMPKVMAKYYEPVPAPQRVQPDQPRDMPSAAERHPAWPPLTKTSGAD